MENQKSIAILKNCLETESTAYGNFLEKTRYRYVIPLSNNRNLRIPIWLIDNTAVKSYCLTRVVRAYDVCYSDLWLHPVTYKDRAQMREDLGLVSAI